MRKESIVAKDTFEKVTVEVVVESQEDLNKLVRTYVINGTRNKFEESLFDKLYKYYKTKDL